MNNPVVKCIRCTTYCNKNRFEGLCKGCFKLKIRNEKKDYTGNVINGLFKAFSKGKSSLRLIDE